MITFLITAVTAALSYCAFYNTLRAIERWILWQAVGKKTTMLIASLWAGLLVCSVLLYWSLEAFPPEQACWKCLGYR